MLWLKENVLDWFLKEKNAKEQKISLSSYSGRNEEKGCAKDGGGGSRRSGRLGDGRWPYANYNVSFPRECMDSENHR